MINEINTTKTILKTTIPKQIYKPKSILKESIKKLTNFIILDNLLYRLHRTKREYILMFEGDFLKIVLRNRYFKIRIYEDW